MILAIDIGNTHILFGRMDEDLGAQVFRIPTDRADTDFGYAAKMKQILDLHKIDCADFQGAIISSVVPPLTRILASTVRMLTSHEPLVVGAGVKIGLQLCVNDPGTVASDIVAVSVAAKEEYPLPSIVIDMGTAITVNAVDENGRYIGSAILPGVGISLDALAKETALLPHIDIQAPTRAIGVTTVECMKSGIVYGTAGATDALIDRFAAALGREPASIVATGGTAAVIIPHCRHKITEDETLLLKGLFHIWKKNQKCK